MKLLLTLIIAVALMAPTALATPGERTFSLPAAAQEVAPGVFYLGHAVDRGRQVEGYAFVHYKGNGAKPATKNTCYGFLARGAKWKTLEPYVVNTANGWGLGSSFVSTNLATDIAKWEFAANKQILGDGSTTNAALEADTTSTDGMNEVYFGSVESPGAIAITIVWGIFSGPAATRELVEWDQVFDQADYGWSSSGEPGKMDFESIATHELGHSVGMDDLYTASCAAQTMYGYAGFGETNKRTLEGGDIAGVKSLYG